MAKRSFSDLPEGMITEIFVRLPVKSLLICKSVCKPWLSTISDPLFVKSQLQHAMNDPSLLVIKEYEPGHGNEGTFMTLDNTSPIKVDSLVVPSMFSGFPVVGYCDGILCLENISHNDVYLWNPSIRQYKRIPAPFRCKFKYYMSGFGYDSISNDYKILCIVFETWTAVIPVVFVYSANAHSWRKFQDPILKNIKFYKGFNVVVKGVLYYNNGNELISFDLHKEVSGLVPFPGFIQKKMSKILDFEGFVAVFFESINGNGPGFDLWTLDDASHQGSWTKKCSLDLITLEYGWSILPYCYLGAGLFFGITSVNEDAIFLPDDEHEHPIFNYILFDSKMRKATDYGHIIE